jgi:hypothetical protein
MYYNNTFFDLKHFMFVMALLMNPFSCLSQKLSLGTQTFENKENEMGGRACPSL